ARAEGLCWGRWWSASGSHGLWWSGRKERRRELQGKWSNKVGGNFGCGEQ
nr:hypothetical protein [Tanacetum cinerariifolium]